MVHKEMKQDATDQKKYTTLPVWEVISDQKVEIN